MSRRVRFWTLHEPKWCRILGCYILRIVDVNAITAGAAANLISDAIEFVVTKIGQRRSDASNSKAISATVDGKHVAMRLNIALTATGRVPLSASSHVRGFLVDPEMTSIARQLCAAVFAGQEASYGPRIQAELSLLFGLIPNIDEPTAEMMAASCVQVLLEEFQAVKPRSTNRLDVSGIAWQELLATHLGNIDQAISLLAGTQLPDRISIRQFTNDLRSQIRQRYNRIVPPSIRTTKRVPIDSIYVPPRVGRVNLKQSQASEASLSETGETGYLTLGKVASDCYRDVVLGSPGAGKTTLVTKLCYELTRESSDIRIVGRRPIPIPVTLRAFSATRKQRDLSILEYIESFISSHLQIKPPPGVLEYLLLTGGLLVIFDGLDELLDTALRRQIADDVESFCHRYTQVPVLITSRKVGYHEAPLDDAVFNTWELADFDYGQVTSYARKWFSIVSEMDDNETRDVDTFMADTDHIWDLRSNPLLLALLCNLYQGSRYIPRYLPEVYESCATMLFERWDSARDLRIPRLFESNRAGALASLAFWIYSTDGLANGVPETTLVHHVAEYLHGRRYRRREDAESAANEFIQYCRGRAWVFTDTGTTGSGEPLYQFTHNTFLEYFAASHLVRVSMTPAAVWGALRERISKGEWAEMATLAVQILQRTAEDGADSLLRMLLADSGTKSAEVRANLLLFASSCLHLIVPSPDTANAVAGALFQTAIENVQYVKEIKKYSLTYNLLTGLFVNLASLGLETENRIPVVDGIEHAARSALDDRAGSSLDVRARLAVGLMRCCATAFDEFDRWEGLLRQSDLTTDDDTQKLIRQLDKIQRVYDRGLITDWERTTESIGLCVHPIPLVA